MPVRRLILLLIILFSVCFVYYWYFHPEKISAQTPTDAIAIRVYSNPDHYSALRWYRAMGFGGSPQSLIVDGYEAVRDGQTVYVNAGNVDLGAIPEVLYTNIYIITYTLGAESATKDIFSQILTRWTFNTNLIAGETWSGEPAVCSDDASVRCLTDRDCARKGYCDSAKAKVTRDTIRLSRLYDIDFLIHAFHEKHKHYPTLEAGTYLPHISLSVWPSWQNTLAKDLGASLPIDPINKLRTCADQYNPVTCWDELAKEFAWPGMINNATLPAGNFVFLYKYGTPADPRRYTICAFSETGMFSDPSKMCNSHCIPSCFGKQCGPDGCGGFCGGGDGECQSGEVCIGGKCQIVCNTSPNCRDGLANGYVVAGYCPAGTGRCYECNPGYTWSAPHCVCNQTCNTPGQPNCLAVAPANSVRSFGSCCTPGESCYQCPYGTTWNGVICEFTCDVTCDTPGQPNCRLSQPANSVERTSGSCCNPGERCYQCQADYVWDSASNSCTCPPVTLNPINNSTIYGKPVGVNVYLEPTLFLNLATITDDQQVTYSMTGNPSWLLISPSTGQIQGSQPNNGANSYTITVRAQNACGLFSLTSFNLQVLSNEWCGDGTVQSLFEACEGPGAGTSINNQWDCIDCQWHGGWCGNGLCDAFYESYISCPEDCLLYIGSDFRYCTDGATQPACYSGAFPTPTMRWQVTPASAQAAFIIQVDDNPDFSSPEFEIEVYGSNNSYTISAPGLIPGTHYNWRIKIRDHLGTWGDWAQCDDGFVANFPC